MNNLKTIIDNIGADATALQNTASNPDYNVWVGASAGTGKTKVLTDRVLRLLLPIEGESDGTPPQNILCITFTKAGASEMTARVMKILSDWAVCDNEKLGQELEGLLGYKPSLKQHDKARRLFAIVIDTPGGLNITTIHAFCQSILGRFTLEANLPPNFKVMEESETQSILMQSRNAMANDVLNGTAGADLRHAFDMLATHKNTQQIDKILRSIAGQRMDIKNFVESYQGLSQSILGVQNYLELTPNDTLDKAFDDYFNDDVFPAQKIRQLATAFDNGTAKNKNVARILFDFCSYDLAQKQLAYNDYELAFLTTEFQPRKKGGLTAGALKSDDQAIDISLEEQTRLLHYREHIKNIQTFESTRALLTIADDFIARFEALKTESRKLDYDDLIIKTRELFTSDMSQWVLYKLDNQIDHILVDEAQDTSPAQWSIITAMLDEFYSGQNAQSDKSDVKRTIFVVGDIKQSIFSFQGANPDVFGEVKTIVQQKIEDVHQPWRSIPMNTSFRSTSAILDMVDATFDTDIMRTALTQDAEMLLPHTAHRHGQSGIVEVWPLYKSPKAEPRTSWPMPISVVPSYDSQAALAGRIADQIADWIDAKDTLKSSGKPINAGDIMILVRRRNALVDHMIRALKSRGVPVSGADRLVITNHIAVQDVLAVMDFGCMPDDDLALACVLKSPFIGWGDDQLEDIAFNREGTLWQAVKAEASTDITAYLTKIIELAPSANAFEMVNDILTFKTPNKDMTGWQAMMSRLGRDAFDPLDEFATQAQNFDANHAGAGVQAFINAMRDNTSDIKRELDDAGGMVRIMTVHASKGLQAPIVFLPDTTAMPKPSGQSDDGFMWVGDTPLWATEAGSQNMVMSDHKSKMNADIANEYQRLLYVAMTRAEDRLIVCGALGKNQSIDKLNESSWYASVQNAIQSRSEIIEWPHDPDYATEPEKFVLETQSLAMKDLKSKDKYAGKTPDLPDWVHHDIVQDQYPPRVLSPSKPDNDPVPVRSPLTSVDDTYRFRRGLLTHALLQYLPDIQMTEREVAGARYLKIQAPDVSDDVKNSILSESLAILDNPQFAPFFGEGSMAEVPVTGMVENVNGRADIISGQIDRLLVDDINSVVWIVDFKSNRPPPTDPNNIPTQYRAQLKAYKTLIRDIYPSHEIRCALLWTDGPFMSELKNL